MEELLFDMHLAEAEIDNNYSQFNDSARKQQLFDAVFQKHGVTKAAFDTSLVWYAANLDIYLEIYDRLIPRYTQLKDTLNARIQRQNELEAKAKRLWEHDSSFTLRPFSPENMFTFRLDTSMYFEAGDMYELSGSVWGVGKSLTPKVFLTWEGADTSIVKRMEIQENGPFKMYITGIPGKVTTSLSGTIAISVGAVNGTSLLVDDLYLYKYRAGYHPEIKEPEIAQKTDSVASDSLPNRILREPEKKRPLQIKEK